MLIIDNNVSAGMMFYYLVVCQVLKSLLFQLPSTALLHNIDETLNLLNE